MWWGVRLCVGWSKDFFGGCVLWGVVRLCFGAVLCGVETGCVVGQVCVRLG